MILSRPVKLSCTYRDLSSRPVCMIMALADPSVCRDSTESQWGRSRFRDNFKFRRTVEAVVQYLLFQSCYRKILCDYSNNYRDM
jgi:hypothetical protein